MNCQRCNLAKHRTKQVVGRGYIPADALFIGEGPGTSEDTLGIPFVGPSGRLLDEAIQDTQAFHVTVPRYYITNTVQCRPCDSKDGPNRQPTSEEAWQCWSNLEAIHRKVKPKEIIYLGKVAEKFCKKAWPHGVLFYHPAYLLRRGGTGTPLYFGFVRDLAEVFKRCLK